MQVTISVWKTFDGIHLEAPGGGAEHTRIDFDPDQPCRVCGDPVLNLAQGGTDICPWCDSGVNRPKMLAYQHEAIKREFLDRYASVDAPEAVPRTDAKAGQ